MSKGTGLRNQPALQKNMPMPVRIGMGLGVILAIVFALWVLMQAAT